MGSLDFAATGITWFGAQAYCRWQTRKKSRWARLPTSAEWEFAYRGKEGRRFPWGDSHEQREKRGFYFGNRKWALPVVGRAPLGGTPEGVEDLLGLVREWTLDLAGPLSKDPMGPGYATLEVRLAESMELPTRGANFVFGGSGEEPPWYANLTTDPGHRVLKGGTWTALPIPPFSEAKLRRTTRPWEVFPERPVYRGGLRPACSVGFRVVYPVQDARQSIQVWEATLDLATGLTRHGAFGIAQEVLETEMPKAKDAGFQTEAAAELLLFVKRGIAWQRVFRKALDLNPMRSSLTDENWDLLWCCMTGDDSEYYDLGEADEGVGVREAGESHVLVRSLTKLPITGRTFRILDAMGIRYRLMLEDTFSRIRALPWIPEEQRSSVVDECIWTSSAASRFVESALRESIDLRTDPLFADYCVGVVRVMQAVSNWNSELSSEYRGVETGIADRLRELANVAPNERLSHDFAAVRKRFEGK